MKQLIFLLLFLTNTLTAQTLTVFTNSNAKHNITTGQIGVKVPLYSTVIFTNNLVTIIDNETTYRFPVMTVEVDHKNNQTIYKCLGKDSNVVTFFLRTSFVAIDFGERDILWVLGTYQKY